MAVIEYIEDRWARKTVQTSWCYSSTILARLIYVVPGCQYLFYAVEWLLYMFIGQSFGTIVTVQNCDCIFLGIAYSSQLFSLLKINFPDASESLSCYQSICELHTSLPRCIRIYDLPNDLDIDEDAGEWADVGEVLPVMSFQFATLRFTCIIAHVVSNSRASDMQMAAKKKLAFKKLPLIGKLSSELEELYDRERAGPLELAENYVAAIAAGAVNTFSTETDRTIEVDIPALYRYARTNAVRSYVDTVFMGTTCKICYVSTSRCLGSWLNTKKQYVALFNYDCTFQSQFRSWGNTKSIWLRSNRFSKEHCDSFLKVIELHQQLQNTCYIGYGGSIAATRHIQAELWKLLQKGNLRNQLLLPREAHISTRVRLASA